MTGKVKAKLISLLLGIALFIPMSLQIVPGAFSDDTVAITVNFVYESNKAMVSQPYTAQIASGAEFKKTVAAPKLYNYSIPVDLAEGLQDDQISFSLDEDKNGFVTFDLAAVEEDVTVTLYYVAGKAKYTVNHHYQNLKDDDFSEIVTVELEGDIDAYTEATANSRPGYICTGVPETVIAADGTTKVDIYYERVFYTVVFDVNGGINGPDPIYAKYGTEFKAEDIKTPTRAGFVFLGWSPLLSDTVTITQDTTYVAQWQPEVGQADYTIVLWGQNANDDEYAYLSSHEAWGNVGGEVTWNPETYICEAGHVHDASCYRLICEQTEHDHQAEGCTLACKHTIHDLACYELTEDDLVNSNRWPYSEHINLFKQLDLTDDCIYIYEGVFTYYYLYKDGNWYTASSSIKGQEIKSNSNVSKYNALCNHTHDDACYSCGKTAHKHTDYTGECYELICPLTSTHSAHTEECKMGWLSPSAELWEYEKSDTVVVNPDGSTVLNVYFTRKEFTLRFRKAYSSSDDYGTITDRWGADIKAEYEAVLSRAGSSFWSTERSGDSPWTNYIGVMPQQDMTYYNHVPDGSGKSTMTYYAEDLQGQYQQIFSISFKGTGYTVTDEDRYQFEGFTYDHGTRNGENCNGAEFYYKRNVYNLEFYSGSLNTPDRSNTPKYEENLGSYDYIPTTRPDHVEDNAVFVGWYRNPECTGERFDLFAHVMPANHLALYAKWVNGLFTVETYLEDKTTLYTYEGYSGIQTDIEKYSLAKEPTAPSKEGKSFVGWFYEEEGVEKPFSFTMPITKDYKLYAKFTDQVLVSYTVHYYRLNTTEKVADDVTRTAMIGSNVTEKAKMGTELNLVPAGEQQRYYPNLTSTSVVLTQQGQEIIFYYSQPSSVQYTVYYRDTMGNNLLDPVVKTTEFSIVTEQYKQIDGYAPQQFQIMMELSADSSKNEIIFIYNRSLTELTLKKEGSDSVDSGQSFLFTVEGMDENTKDIKISVLICANGERTISALPLGRYRVTEQTAWSWRYTPQQNEQEILLGSEASQNMLTFINEREEKKWLDGGAYKENLFNNTEQ